MPENISKSVIKNELKWYWFTTCKRYTAHKTADCKKTPCKSKKATAISAQSHSAASKYEADTDDQGQDSDSGSSCATYKAKKMGRPKTPDSP